MATFEEVFREWARQAPGTPRRLMYALPQGSVVEPVVAQVRGWLDRLGLADEVGVHVATGIWAISHGPDWRADMHRPAVVIGTTEVLVSKALNRAFGVGSTLWPIDFALVANGAHWVVADPERSPVAVATLRALGELLRGVDQSRTRCGRRGGLVLGVDRAARQFGVVERDIGDRAREVAVGG